MYYNESIKIKDDFPYAYYYKGTIYIKTEIYDSAVNEFAKVLTYWPGNSEVYYQRGLAFQELSEFNQAIKDWNNCILLDSTNNNPLQSDVFDDLHNIGHVGLY